MKVSILSLQINVVVNPINSQDVNGKLEVWHFLKKIDHFIYISEINANNQIIMRTILLDLLIKHLFQRSTRKRCDGELCIPLCHYLDSCVHAICQLETQSNHVTIIKVAILLRYRISKPHEYLCNYHKTQWQSPRLGSMSIAWIYWFYGINIINKSKHPVEKMWHIHESYN